MPFTPELLDELLKDYQKPEDLLFKLLYLALRNISKRWTMPVRDWSAALNQFAILFEGRVPICS